MCFTTDPYCTEEMAATTREAIKLFRKYDVPFTVLTKNGKRAENDFSLYRSCDAFGTTLTIRDRSSIEPYAGTRFERTHALFLAHKRNIRTWVSFEPVLNEWDVIDLFALTKGWVDLYKIGKTNHGYPHNVQDWGAFGRRMVELCERHGKAYYIKEDLRAEMEKGCKP